MTSREDAIKKAAESIYEIILDSDHINEMVSEVAFNLDADNDNPIDLHDKHENIVDEELENLTEELFKAVGRRMAQ